MLTPERNGPSIGSSDSPLGLCWAWGLHYCSPHGFHWHCELGVILLLLSGDESPDPPVSRLWQHSSEEGRNTLLLLSGVWVQALHTVSMDTIGGGGPPVVLWGWESWLSTFLLWHHSGKSVGVPVKERSLGFRSVFAGGGGDGTTVFSVVFGVKPWLSKHFLSGYNAPLSSVEREQAFVEAFFGLRFLVFLDCQLSSTSSGIFEAKRKPRECTAYRSLGANLPSCFAYFSLPRLQSSHTYFF